MKKLILVIMLLITMVLTACSNNTKEEQQNIVEKQKQQDLFNQLDIVNKEESLNEIDTTQNLDNELNQELINKNEKISKSLRDDIDLNMEEVETINISDYSWYTALNPGEFFEDGHKLIIYALLKYYNNEVPYKFSCNTTDDNLEMPTGSLFKIKVHSDNPDEPSIDFYFDLYENKIQVN